MISTQDIRDIQQIVHQQILQLKEDMLNKIIKDILGRDFQITDAANFEIRQFIGRMNEEYLFYKGKNIGRMYITYDNGLENNNITYHFEPANIG
jgi:hypothetical protein